MSETVNIHDAKTHFSRLVERAANGETVIIAKAGKPVARLMPLEGGTGRTGQRYGFMQGKVPEDFDRMFEDEIAELFGAS